MGRNRKDFGLTFNMLLDGKRVVIL